MKNYMNENKDSISRRREREEKQVELRSIRREELRTKKRNTTLPSSIPTNTKYGKLKEKLYSPDIKIIHEGVHEFRKLLSLQDSPPIQAVVDAGVLPRLVELLSPMCSSYLKEEENKNLSYTIRFEAAWAVTNIASGNSQQTSAVVECGAIPLLVDMIGESKEEIVDQAIWALGNIAGESEIYRDVIINSGAINQLLDLMIKIIPIEKYTKILKNCTWLLSNLNRGRTPPPPKEHIHQSLTIFHKLLEHNDIEILIDTLWALGYIADMDEESSDLVLKLGAIDKAKIIFLKFLGEKGPDKNLKRLIPPTVRLIGNIVTGTDKQTDEVIRLGVLPLLKRVFYSVDSNKVKKEICWIISNIAAGTPDQCEEVFKSKMVPLLVDSLECELFIKIEACYAINNLFSNTDVNTSHLQQLINLDLIEGIRGALPALENTPIVQRMLLTVIDLGITGGEEFRKKGNKNPMIEIIKETNLAEEIREAQDSSDKKTSELAQKIIEKYEEQEDDF